MPRTAVLLVPLLVVCVSAGCLEPCTVDTITWTEPGLYDFLPETGRQGSYEFLARGLPSGIPIEAPVLAERWGDGFSLRTVHWRIANGSEAETMSVGHEDGTLYIHGGFLNADDGTVRTHFDALVRNVTSADRATRDAWAGSFLANRSHGAAVSIDADGNRTEWTSFRVAVDSVDRLGEVWTSLHETRVLIWGSGQTPGGRYEFGGGWRFHFDLDTKAGRGADAGARIGLTVDVGDRTELAVSGGTILNEKTMDEGELRAQVNRTLADVGFGEAHLSDARVGGIRC